MHVSSLELKQILQEEVHGEIALVVLGRRIKELKELDYSNMTMDDWQAAIAGDCERIAKILQRALIEHLLDRVIRKTSRIIGLSLRKQLGVSPTTLDQLLGESVERMIRNLVEGYLFNTEFMQKMTKTISEKICEIDLADAFQGAFSE